MSNVRVLGALKCRDCGLEFTDVYLLQVHKKSHQSVEKSFKCQLCGETFTQHDLLLKHRETHTGDTSWPFTCEKNGPHETEETVNSLDRRGIKSGKRFHLKHMSERHNKTDIVTSSIKCKFCEKILQSSDELNAHTQEFHKGDRPFLCNICGKKFSRKYHLNRHIRFHSDERPFQCSFCGKSFKDKSGVPKHEITHTGERPFPCRFCGKRFGRSSHVRFHERNNCSQRSSVEKPDDKNHHKQKRDMNDIDNKNHRKQNRHRQRRDVNDIDNKNHRDQRRDVNVIDNDKHRKKVSQPGAVKEHLTTDASMSESSYDLDIPVTSPSTNDPDREIIGVYRLECHEKTYLTEKTCHVCGKRFHRYMDLLQHRKNVHLEVWRETSTSNFRYRCSVCNKGFRHKALAERHRRTHSKTDPNQCKFCGKVLESSDELKTHTREFHTGARPFYCKQCGKKFSRKYHLKRHVSSHSEERPFKCVTCHKYFKTKDVLRNHRRAHSGERPFPCCFCGKRFVYDSNARIHERKHCSQRSNHVLT